MNLLFDFTVDKDKATIYVTREFAADIDIVWDAFTKAEILDQWMGPKPWRVQTKVMDFRKGGRWLYNMVSAENVPSERFSLAEYVDVQPKSSFTTKNSFADKNGNPIKSDFTFSLTRYTFEAGIEKTTVRISKKMASLTELEQFIAGGYYEKGTAMGMNNLDEYLLTQVATK